MKTFVLALLLGVLPAYAQDSPATPQQNSDAAGGTNSTAPQQNPNATSAENRQGLTQKGIDRIIKEVHHELVLLPFYGVFDNLAYKVTPDGTVTLLGQVSRPTLKTDAERAVKHIEGVERVDRRDTYRAIYGNEVLSQYSLRAVPPIHVIVKNGNVTLEGVVARQMDRQIAEMQAKSVPGVFSVTNNLRVETD